MRVNDAYRIRIDDSRVTLQIVASLTDDSKGVIYICKMFKVKATGAYPSHLLAGIRLGRFRDKRSNVLQTLVNYGRKKFYDIGLRAPLPDSSTEKRTRLNLLPPSLVQVSVL